MCVGLHACAIQRAHTVPAVGPTAGAGHDDNYLYPDRGHPYAHDVRPAQARYQQTLGRERCVLSVDSGKGTKRKPLSADTLRKLLRV